jgi:hypothetical protein
MLYLATQHPFLYNSILQEDRFVEWLSAALFIAAGSLRVIAAVRQRRLFDLLVGLFCIFVGGEEFSWGQRLLGFTPPDVFLEHNTQQEFTLHNFADIFGKPKGMLILSLLGYGLLLPILHRTGGGRRALERIGATVVSTRVAWWVTVAAILLIWYPVELTGEWVEALAGFLFFIAAPVSFSTRRVAGGAVLLSAALLTFVSARMAVGGPGMVRCAALEADAVLADVTAALDAYPDLVERDVHKRLYTAVQEGYVSAEMLNYLGTRCEGESDRASDRRKRYMVDPWGLAYWVSSRRLDERVRITVYSFGPNKSRDARDISASLEFAVPPYVD